MQIFINVQIYALATNISGAVIDRIIAEYVL